MKHFLTILFCFAATVFASGQTTTRDYYDSGDISYVDSEIVSEDFLFNIPLEGSTSLFSRMSEFNFSAVRYNRRGYDNNHVRYMISGIDLRSPLTSRPDYNIVSALNRSVSVRSYASGLASNGFDVGGVGGIYSIVGRASLMPEGNVVSIFTADRRYRMGFKFSTTGSTGNGKLFYSASVYRRWGEDPHINGVFTDETAFSFAGEYRINDNHAVSVNLVAAPSEQGLRSASTREAFELTGDNAYNPSWGYHNGKVRNSKVRESFRPMAVISYTGRIGDNTTARASVSGRFGKSAYSALRWYNAANPNPDYYRDMPSFFVTIGDSIRRHWLESNTDVTQINWAELYYQNKNSEDELPAYILEDRIEDVTDLQFVAAFHTRVDSKVELDYGLRLRTEKTSYYKKLKDMLGSAPFTDVDQYLIDDEYFNDKKHNNIRDRERKVRVGDRFGYNYDMDYLGATAFGMLHFRERDYRLTFGVDLGAAGYHRNGHYEKELYPGNLSYGKSKRVYFNPYTLKFDGSLYINARHALSLRAMVGGQTPGYDNIFLSPLYTNYKIDKPGLVKTGSFELDYDATIPWAKFKVSGYFTKSGSETDIYRYFDDISTEYCNMVLSDVEKVYYGFEVGAEIPLSQRFTLSAVAALSSHRYGSDPGVDIYTESDMEILVVDSKSYLKDFRLGSSPQAVASAEINYASRTGWFITGKFSYMGENFVSPAPQRRMKRVTDYASASPEMYEKFVTQEKLPDAFVVGLSVIKTIAINKSRMNIVFSVDNLLNDGSIVYSGYEQARFYKKGSGINQTYHPFDSKYLYSYGRTYYASVIYKF